MTTQPDPILAASASVMLAALAMPWGGGGPSPIQIHPFHLYAFVQEASWDFPAPWFQLWTLAFAASTVGLIWTLARVARRRDASRAALVTGGLAVGLVAIAALATRGGELRPVWGAHLYAAGGAAMLWAALRARAGKGPKLSA